MNKQTVFIATAIASLHELVKKETGNRLDFNEPIIISRPNVPELHVHGMKKVRTNPCKRHEYVNDVCRNCNHPLK